MSHQATLHLLAIVFLICVVFVAAIDIGADFGIWPSVWLKWTLLWVVVRYIAIICGTLLALDVLF